MRSAHTVDQVRAAERDLMARLPEGTLMARAAAGLAAVVVDLMGGAYGRRVLLLVGAGDNGGDALYAGALLARRGCGVEAVLLSSAAHPGGLAALSSAGGRVVAAGEAARPDVLVDGIVGIGGRPGLRPAALAELGRHPGVPIVAVDVPSGLPKIQGDHYQLTQLFTNLLINAYEAMDGKGHVGFSASAVRQEDGADGRDAVRVELTDDGPGMPQEVADRVFDPFFTTKPQGSGLGLAIVRKIVDAHDGQIDLRTAPGGGTLIRVTLPVSVSRDAV